MMQTLQDLKCWLSADHVSKWCIISFTLFLSCGKPVFGQQVYDIDNVYYQLIEEIISKDTVPSDITKKFLTNGLQTGKYSKEDSLTFIKNIREKELRLFKYTSNNALKEELFYQLGRESSSVVEFFGNDEIRKIIDSIPYNTIHNRNLLAGNIILFDDIKTTTTGHFFSSAIKVKSGLYLVYHIDKNNSIEARRSLLIFRPDEIGGYVLEKLYHLTL